MSVYRTIGPLVNFIISLNIQLFWFPAGQGLKKVIFVLLYKVDKISSVSEKTINQNTFFTILLAHLSRRLKGELIVYRSIRRPCVSALVR